MHIERKGDVALTYWKYQAMQPTKDMADGGQEGVDLQPPQQYAGGAQQQSCACAAPSLQPDLIAGNAAHPFTPVKDDASVVVQNEECLRHQ